VTHSKTLHLTAVLILIGIACTGCEKLQPGYYLTPENVPTLPSDGTPITQGEGLSPTPPSTVRPLSTLTNTPFGATTAPSATSTLTPTATQPPCTEAEGEIVEETFLSEAAAGEVRYRVYLPPCYSTTNKRYPVLYMFHGLGDLMDDAQWIRIGLTAAADRGFADGSLPPMIIVMPNGNDALYGGDEGPFPEMVTNELVPLIDTRFCTWGEPAKRAIGGLSRGGYWAFWIAFKHPEMFARLGGHSPYLYQPTLATNKNAFNIVDTAVGIENLAIYMDHGGEGREINEVKPGVQEMIDSLGHRGITPTYVANTTGDHTEGYWAMHVAEYLTFYAELWPRDVTQYPACQ
jgi:enterochelin esterase-like enzyme